jgi:hypothetical protein
MRQDQTFDLPPQVLRTSKECTGLGGALSQPPHRVGRVVYVLAGGGACILELLRTLTRSLGTSRDPLEHGKY